MRRRFLPAALSLFLAMPGAGIAAAQTASEARAMAEEAAAQLRQAVGKLGDALTADDQVTALTEVIRGYEQGQAALREGLRQAALREVELRDRFESQRESLSDVLGVMMAMERSPETALLLHPSGAEDTARAGMILSAVTPGLRAEAERLQADLDEITAVRTLQENAASMLNEGLASVQEARRLLTSAVTDRSTMPVRFAENPEELQNLQASADSLDEFARGIAGMEDDVGPPMEDFAGAQGNLRLPATGEIVRYYNEADAAGVQRPGIVIATAPAALVTTPWPATIRYRGPLLDYGNVMIAEPARGYLLVFAGLDQVFGEVGDVLAAGEPVGLMGGSEARAAEFGAQFVADAAAGGGAGRTETLYVELRQGGETLDPGEWFVMNPIVQPQE